jgi:hypothetical protein
LAESGSQILAFYRGEGTDGRGRKLRQILAWPDERLEDVHDYIQWLFPLVEPSAFNPGAPLLDRQTIEEFRRDGSLQAALRGSLERMLRFYRLELRTEASVPVVRETAAFGESARNWLCPGNHNHLRITRILRGLSLCGLEAEANAFFTCLSRIYEAERRKARPGITDDTFRYWRSAVSSAAGHGEPFR